MYKVPDTEEYNNIAGGGRILMQWYYATANSCFSPGYKGTAIGDYLNSKGWLRSGGNLSSCNLPFDKTGQGSPERVRFKHCTFQPVILVIFDQIWNNETLLTHYIYMHYL